MNVSAHQQRLATRKTLRFPVACAYTLLTALVAALILLLTSAIFTYVQADPTRIALPFALGALYLSSLVGGVAAARLSDAPYSAASLAGAVYMLITLALSVFPLGEAFCNFSFFVNLLARVAIIAASVLGAFLGRKRKKRPTAHHKKRRR